MKEAILAGGIVLLFLTPTISHSQVAFCPPCDNVKKICPSFCKKDIGFGVCVPPGLCKGTGFESGAGNPGGAIDAGLQALSGLIQKALMGGGGGGGGMPPPTDLLNQEQEEKTTAADLLEDIANEKSVSPFDVLSGAFGTETQSETEEIAENTRTTVQLITDTVQKISEGLQKATGVTVGEGRITPNRAAGNDIRDNVSSNTEVVETERGVTIRTEVVDEETNTGVGSFFGSSRPPVTSSEQSATIVGRLCTAQPWQTSIVSRIFSSRFFDSMCENRGYIPGGQEKEEMVKQPVQESTFIDERLGRAQLTCPSSVILGDAAEIEWTCGAAIRSAGIGFETNGWPTGSASVRPTENTTYTLECSQGGNASCAVGIIGPSIQIVAHPQRVPLGARTRLYWAGENVAECTVSGPGLQENALRGAATTEAILDQTEYILTCETPGGSVVEAKTIVDVGI